MGNSNIVRIQRFSNPLTRRQVGAVLTGAAFGNLGSRALAADGAPWTVAIVPDPQFLAAAPNASCSMYDRLIQWAIDNRNTSINGVPLNLKGFIQVGDCQDTALVATANSQEVIAVNAWNKAIPANLFVAWCCGNHDYEGGGSQINRSRIGHAWRADTNGAWAPANLAAKYGSGIDIGNGDFALWGGVYSDPTYVRSSANNFIRIQVGSRKILIIALEFFPRSAVLNWAKELHDGWPDHEVWVTTHGYMDTLGAQCGRDATYGPSRYSMGLSPSSNSGQEMWGGSDASWAGLTRWPRLGLVTCGHWIDGYSQGWVWQKREDTGLAGQTTLQVFCDAQMADTTNACSADRPDGVRDVAHLMLFRVWPTSCEAYMVSTNTGLWTGARGVRSSSTPVQLFSIPFLSLNPSPSPIGVAVSAILSSASGDSAVTPGSWVSLYGANLAGSTRAWRSSDFVGTTLPVVIDGVSVRFNGKSAAISYVSPVQVNVQAPDDIGTGPVTVEVTTPSGAATRTVTVQMLAPGFFTFQNKYIAAVRLDGIYVAPINYFGSAVVSRPARRGEILMLYGTGFGPTTPQVRTGQIVREAAPLASSSQLQILVGGLRAEVQYAGLVAAGQYQVNMVVPNLPDGDHAIVADLNGIRTQTGILLPVSG